MHTGISVPLSAIALCLITSLSTNSSCAEKGLRPSTLPFVKGYSWGWVGSRGSYASNEAAESMEKLADTGTEWVCIAFAANMKSSQDPEFTWGDESTDMVTDEEVRRAIDLARSNGMKVILKPVVNCSDGTWRAWIKFYRALTAEELKAGKAGELDTWGERIVLRPRETKDRAKWDTWWKNYSDFLVHYAEIAQEKKVPILCIGCEMNSSEEFEQQWRDTIQRVRGSYDGLLTYDCNHGRERQLRWWDCLDFISISAYYAVPPEEGQSLEEAILQTTPREQIKKQLEKVKVYLAELSATHNKPILFIETGVTNVRGCARYPWEHPYAKPESHIDEQEQANYYSAMFEVFWNEPWFMGFAWWDWPSQLYDVDKAANDRGFCVFGREAEKTLRTWYAKPSPRRQASK